MPSIDIEIAALQARIAKLEEKKRTARRIKPLEELHDEIQNKIEKNQYAKHAQLSAHYDKQRLELIQSIIDSLNKINIRLDALENE
jgi:hypothetical protein